MNTKFALLSTALVAVLTLIILRQTSHYVKTESIIKKYDISSITGQIKDKNMKKDNVTNKVMTNDTHDKFHK
jgi:predicted secreted Zn-dependent protease